MDTAGSFTVIRAKPSDAEAIAEFVGAATRGRVSVAPQSIMDRFGAKGLWLVRSDEGQIVGLAGWRAENLIARVDDFLIFPHDLYPTAGKVLVQRIEEAAQELQCEVSMFFVPSRASAILVRFYQDCGYKRPELEGLPRVWQETAQEAEERGRYVMMRRLREDLVLRPM
jgi:N-acetylglutamate synthase-like GNAT family acetyltransferase